MVTYRWAVEKLWVSTIKIIAKNCWTTKQILTATLPTALHYTTLHKAKLFDMLFTLIIWLILESLLLWETNWVTNTFWLMRIFFPGAKCHSKSRQLSTSLARQCLCQRCKFLRRHRQVEECRPAEQRNA